MAADVRPVPGRRRAPGRLTTRPAGRRAAELAALRALERREMTRLLASPAQAGLTLLNPLLYFVVLGLTMLPLFFLSGAMFSVAGLP
ncbi:hypothetical protein [Streptomyces sp. NBC_01716]|uniref:hypothetical protein n=1 Tax=Streptomyces sp. NBC_01716 TaxID=2975917 RepID=UPI002E303A94|nr:hypothetical protein [Streptomyces sp. NBC_01716]